MNTLHNIPGNWPADHATYTEYASTDDRFRPCPWIPLETPPEAENWIDEHNRSMQEHLGVRDTGAAVAMTLTEGGRLYLRTGEDAIMVELEADAQWIAPLIEAATGAQPPRGQLWVLPADRLVQLILGLSSLVEYTTLVAGRRSKTAGHAGRTGGEVRR